MSCQGPHCTGCPQQQVGQRYIPPDGRGNSGILVLAESPWLEEMKLGRPLVGASGHTFDKLLRRAGIERESLLVTNVMNCKAPHLGWFDKQKLAAAVATEHCRPYLDELVRDTGPRVIVTLGGVALSRVTNFRDVTEHHAYVHESCYGIPVIPTFHPSYIQRGNHKLSAAVIFALRRAAAIAGSQGKFGRSETRYLLDPSPAELAAYMEPWDESLLTFDIETTYSTKVVEDEVEEDGSFEIIRVSFAWREGEAVSVPWCEPYIGLCKRLLVGARRTVFWNQNFDVPRLRAAGVEFKGEIADGMWAWHFLQSDLPKSLGFVAPFYSDLPAWKHLSDSQPAYYSAVDADATLRCYLGIKRDLEEQGRWGQFEGHCTGVLPMLGAMGDKGLLVAEDRQQAFKGKLEEQLVEAKAQLQLLVPEAVKPRKTYKKPPAELAELPPTRLEPCACAAGTELVLDKVCRRCKGTQQVPVWDKLLDFNPDSPKQVLALIEHCKLAVPKNRKTQEASTGAKHLERFAKKHEVFRWVLECRTRADMLGTFIWPANIDGRVTTSYGFHPSTWRKCVAKGTMVSTPDGDIPVERLRVGQLVYSYDDNLQLQLKPVLWAGKTGHKKVIRLSWKAMGCHAIKGHVDVTPDHLVRLLDGSYKEAQTLAITWGRRKRTTPGDRILALRRGNFGEGYVRLSGTGFPTNRSSMLEHRFVYWFHTGEWPPHVHHVNDVKGDNRFNNLQGMTIPEHLSLTGKRRGRKLRGRDGWEKYQLRKHLKDTNYKLDVPFCAYQVANHRIMGIEALPEAVDVYDVEVQDTHNFIANELCVHNSSRSVNLQNMPKRSDLAGEFRKMLVAAPGHVLVEADSAAIEAVLVGHFADDLSYVRLAKLGVHDFLASHIVGEPANPGWEDELLRPFLTRIKKQHKDVREAAKRVVHGSNYGLTPYGMNDEYREYFPTIKAAAEMQRLYFELFPKIKQWHSHLLARTAHDNYLQNPFGYRHYFYHPLKFSWERYEALTAEYGLAGLAEVEAKARAKAESWEFGDDAKRAIAFLPQSTASALQTEYLLRLWGDAVVRPCLRLIVHDSFILEVPCQSLDYVAGMVYNTMVSPIAELQGLAVGAEVQVGDSLGEMEVWNGASKRISGPVSVPVELLSSVG